MRISDWSSDVCSSDLRAYDQVVHDVAIQNLPVRFAIDRAGLLGADGSTHAGSFDVTYLAPLPKLVVLEASDEAELVHMTYTVAEYYDGTLPFPYANRQSSVREIVWYLVYISVVSVSLKKKTS